MGELVDDLQERLADARTLALMGDREGALAQARRADLEYRASRDVLRGFPGAHALEHALYITLESLCRQQDEADAEENRLLEAQAVSRRKTVRRKAA